MMKAQLTSHISMREFLRLGQLGTFQLGDSIDALKTAFGEPSDVGGISRRHRMPRVLKYGDIEFHVTADAKHIGLIFCDTFTRLRFCAGVSFDPWFFDGHPSIESVELALNRERLAFHQGDMLNEPTGRLLRLDSGVELMFSKGNDPFIAPGVPGLFGFQYADKSK